MNTKLTVEQQDMLKRTGQVRASIAIAAETMVRNDGSATVTQIQNEIHRRLVEPFDGLLKDTHKDRHKTELSSVMSSGNGWIQCSGNGTWTIEPHAYSDIIDQLEGSRAFGFDSYDEFIDVLNLATEPFGTVGSLLDENDLNQAADAAKDQANDLEADYQKAVEDCEQLEKDDFFQKMSGILDRLEEQLDRLENQDRGLKAKIADL